jgi:hypothetical protein
MFSHRQQEQNIELLWTGPSPDSQIPARRIDQVLYDLIDSAKREILLVTFAAHKISRLTAGLVKPRVSVEQARASRTGHD